MATKNTVGNTYKRFKQREARLVRKIDKRDENGKNRENVDDTFRNYAHITNNGERVWSF